MEGATEVDPGNPWDFTVPNGAQVPLPFTKLPPLLNGRFKILSLWV